MPLLLWDCTLYASTLISRGSAFGRAEDHYQMLYMTGEELTATLVANAHGHWPPLAVVDDERVFLGVTEADGATRIGRAERELLHGRKFSFTLWAEEALPAEAWGTFRLKHFDIHREMPEA